ncbi:MAG: MobA/MobL family protein, partial [Coriobacteriales bacterium]
HLTAQELKEELERGAEWEKVYRYNDGQKLTKTQAQEQGLDPVHDRVRKQPVQTTVYINNGWNDTDQLERWRDQWQDRANDYLERAGYEVRVDYRSYEEQGIEREPMVHEGYAVRAIEREAQERAYERGEDYEPVTDVRQHNLEVEEANRLIERLERELERVNLAIRERLRELEIELERVHEQVRAGLERTYERVAEYGRERVEQVREAAREVGMGMQERLQRVRSVLADSLDNPRTQERGQREAGLTDMRAEPLARTAAMTNARLLQREPAREVYVREQSRILLEREPETGIEYERSR